MNPQLQMTLDDCVGEVLNQLTGLDLHYVAELDRYRSITKHLNRALRLVATEEDWSYYAALENLGTLSEGQTSVHLRSARRPRINMDDAARVVDQNGNIRLWAHFLPRESLHKYQGRSGLWIASTRSEVTFSRKIRSQEAGYNLYLPVMREPHQFITPETLESVEDLVTPPAVIPTGGELLQLRNYHNPDIVEEWVTIDGLPPYRFTGPEQALGAQGYTPEQIRQQLLDFPYPDLIILKAAFLYAQTDPVMQPRVQTLEGTYKDLFYGLVERDTDHTDEPYLNTWNVPIQSSLSGNPYRGPHAHPHSDERNIINYR